ncbi:hypothetical protein [Mycolicibacterium gilvum]|uniref:Esterase/lipase n=1 Tax=Mycolicibacterium gilvum TaxID=1804 RepID=A0A378SKG9_9MYCO|nr:hypothetical protein [Mycolicibacterium gilvum]MCV7056058.1 hypothetical protein [Mycolicibacterium gilvum]STZ41907.1 esterase/lipase [Mycolicibacterium gilvum]
MGDRLSVLIGAGVLAAGMSTAVLTGAGVAVASPDTASSTSATSETSDTSGSERVSEKPADPRGEKADETPDETEAPDSVEDVVQDLDDEPDETDDRDDAATEADLDTDVAVDADEADEVADVEEPQADVEVPAVEVPAVVDQPASTVAVEEPVAAVLVPATTTTPIEAHVARASASEAATPPRRQTLLSVLGAVVFNIYSVALRVLGGPPILPPNSTVTVRSSTLTIDCGDGYEVPADWYVPDGPTPTRLIYFQHGFMAAGPFYSFTAARLAEATHSIVVTTSLTSNFLACDGCWVGGTPMHRAVADLFGDGNSALGDSAVAAGYAGALLDGVDKVALIGHSAGGGLAAGAAAAMTGNGAFDRLAGVVMLDGVGFGDVTPRALERLPLDFPIYNLAARSYFWNMSGTTNTAMETWRPGGFNGVKLDDSSHGDAMTGGNVFVQVAMNLVTGWPKPANARAAELISAGWLDDMFTATSASGFYGAPNATLSIETASGVATARVLPGPAEKLTFIDRLFTAGSMILFGIDFATCADTDAGPEAQIGESAGIGRPNTALSLDGRAKAGQSIGQQCVHG